MTTLFETAARNKFRFTTPVGMITTEDLWDLPLTSTRGASLDNIAKALHKELKEDVEVSFVKPSTASNTLTQQMFDIVKYVIEVKMAERDTAKLAADNAAKKQEIMSLIAKKKNDKLSETSLEDLESMLNNL